MFSMQKNKKFGVLLPKTVKPLVLYCIVYFYVFFVVKWTCSRFWEVRDDKGGPNRNLGSEQLSMVSYTTCRYESRSYIGI